MVTVPRILVVFHSYGTAPTQFAIDLSKAMRYSGTIIPEAHHEASCYVDTARNKCVKHFLSTTFSHMMMLDVDMSFDSDAILKTFTIMNAYQADLIYGNYALGSGANSLFGPPENKAKEAAVRVKLEPNKVYADVATGGTGWLMATRQLLERMQKECPGPWHWFARDLTNDKSDFRGEDVSFGLRAWGLDPKPKIVGTTAILLKHLKYQGLYPDFMGPVVANQKEVGICLPNPYETDKENYAIIGSSVVELKSLTPEQRQEVLAEAERHARSTGTEPESPGQEEETRQEASGSLRVRDSQEDGLETGEGKGPDGHG
jgi:hypothetical protein